MTKENKELTIKKAAELKLKNEQIRAAAAEDEKRKQALQQQAQEAERQVGEEKAFKVTPVPGADISPLFKAYREEIKKEPEKRPDGSQVLVFDTLKQASEFFVNRSKEKNIFLCVEENKGFMGHNFYSCGDGHLYEGSLDDIIAGLKKAVEADANNKEAADGLEYIASLQPKPSPNPATAFRDVLGSNKPKTAPALSPPAEKKDEHSHQPKGQK